MARARNRSVGRVDRLDQLKARQRAIQNWSIEILHQTQNALQQQLAAFAAQQAAEKIRRAESDRRFQETAARIDACCDRIDNMLHELVRLARALPDAILDKIGFRSTRETARN